MLSTLVGEQKRTLVAIKPPPPVRLDHHCHTQSSLLHAVAQGRALHLAMVGNPAACVHVTFKA